MSSDERVEIFREAILADAAAICALVNSAYRGDSSRAGWTTEADLLGGQRVDVEKISATIASVESKILLGVDAALAIVACVQLDRLADGAYLGMLTVSPTLQAGGLGKKLLAYAENFAREIWHSRFVEMTVISVRAELIAWYARRGYVNTGEHRPFPAGDPRFGLPKQPLEFVVLRKAI